MASDSAVVEVPQPKPLGITFSRAIPDISHDGGSASGRDKGRNDRSGGNREETGNCRETGP